MMNTDESKNCFFINDKNRKILNNFSFLNFALLNNKSIDLKIVSNIQI